MKYYLYQWHNKFIHINQLKIDKAMEYRNSKLKNKGI